MCNYRLTCSMEWGYHLKGLVPVQEAGWIWATSQVWPNKAIYILLFAYSHIYSADTVHIDTSFWWLRDILPFACFALVTGEIFCPSIGCFASLVWGGPKCPNGQDLAYSTITMKCLWHFCLWLVQYVKKNADSPCIKGQWPRFIYIFTLGVTCHSHCINTISTLYSHYIHTVFTLYSHWIHTIFTLYSHYIHTVFTLYSHCIHTIFTLYSHCIHTIFTLYSHYIHTIFTLYWL